MTPPSNIRFPRDLEFLDDLQLLVYRPEGVLNEKAINRAIRIVGELEFSLQHPFNRFIDTLETEGVDLNFRYVLHVSLYRRLSYSRRPPVKSAILATDTTAIHYARLHAVLTQGSAIKVRVFQDIKDAAKWLKVPVEQLANAASRHGAAESASSLRPQVRSPDKRQVSKPSREVHHLRVLDDP